MKSGTGLVAIPSCFGSGGSVCVCVYAVCTDYSNDHVAVKKKTGKKKENPHLYYITRYLHFELGSKQQHFRFSHHFCRENPFRPELAGSATNTQKVNKSKLNSTLSLSWMFVFLADDFLLWDLFKCLSHMIGLQIVYQTRGCQQCSSALSVSLCLSVLCVVRIDFSSLPNPPPPTSLFECVQHSVLSPSLSVMYIYSVCRLSSHLSLYLNSLAEAPMFAGLLLKLYSSTTLAIQL